MLFVAQIILIEIVLVYYCNIYLKTSAYNSYQQQLRMVTQVYLLCNEHAV
jgi:hypothetical protein